MNFVQSGTFFGLFVLLIAGGYVFGAYVLYRIGSRFGVGSFGDYFIPVFNWVLLCRCAEISPWLLLAPPIGFAHLWGTLAKKLGHGYWIFGLGMLLLGIPALVLAFENPDAASRKPSLYFLSGEFPGSRLPVAAAGLTIGRSADKSNLVLSSLEVSALHARIWSDGGGRVWVEDMRSSNGTYYCNPRQGEAPEWIEVREPVALIRGTHLRLGDNAAEFVVS